jgi:hypothetical protein
MPEKNKEYGLENKEVRVNIFQNINPYGQFSVKTPTPVHLLLKVGKHLHELQA